MRSFTVQNLLDRAIRKADMENTDFIGDAEALDTFNEAYTWLYDLLVSAFENYKVKEQFITLVLGQHDYDLPDDYYKTIGMDFEIGLNSTQYVTLKPFTEAERNGVTGIQSNVPNGRVRHRYVPAPAIYTDLSDTVDGVSGWEELIVNEMAMQFLQKEESSTTYLERRQEQLTKRIEIMAQNRDVGMPARVNDIEKIDIYRQYATLRYQLNDGDVRFLTTEIITPLFMGVY